MMKVGILSDTHNDIQTLRTILRRLREEKINTVIHCGDITSPEIVKYFNGLTVHLAFGNGDYLTGALKEEIILLGTNSTAQRLNTLNLAGKQVLIAHGNYPRELQELALSGRFDLIFTGHTHQREQIMVEKTRMINPGAAHRTGVPAKSYALYNFCKDTVDFYQIN